MSRYVSGSAWYVGVAYYHGGVEEDSEVMEWESIAVSPCLRSA
jgi:hypothetical protein